MDSSFIKALKDFVNKEQNTQNRQVLEMWAQPVGQRVVEGEAIADLEVIYRSPRQAVLRFRENISKFRPGDSLRLSRGDPRSDYIACELDAERGNELVLIPGFRSNFNNLQTGGGWVLDRGITDTRQILLDFLSSVSANPDWENYFRGMFSGKIAPRINPQRVLAAKRLASKIDFNPAQREAFLKSYATENYYLVQGPPGTGKTWVLAHLAAALASEGQRVLVTGFTHRAINNALVKIAKVTGFHPVIKVGPRRYADDLTWEGGQVPNFEYFTDSLLGMGTMGFVVGGTCYALRGKRLKDVIFDTVIFDEAGQVTLPLAMAGICAGSRAIFVGDHQQMPPVIVAEHKSEWVTKSIFETLYWHAPGTMLNITYRMNERINLFPSRVFYNGRLLSSEKCAGQKLKLTRQPQQYSDLLDADAPDIFAEIPHTRRGMRSPEEARLAAGIALEAVNCGVNPEEIAIVAPYRAQGRLIRAHLHELAGQSGMDGLEKIVVDTVERIQGQEREVVIISLTTSDPLHAANRAEFFFQPNRLNVAITRPKVKRIVIGSPHLFTTQAADEKVQSWVALFKELYQQARIIRVPLDGLDKAPE